MARAVLTIQKNGKTLKKEFSDSHSIDFSEISGTVIDIKIDNQFKKISSNEIYTIFQDISTVLDAKLTILEALEAVKIFSKSKASEFFIDSILDSLDSGKSISTVLENYQTSISKLIIFYIRFGEDSGNLNLALLLLAEKLKAIRNISQKLKKSLIYPFIIILLTILAFILIVIFIIPKFEAIFRNSGNQLPIFTELILNLYNFILNYGVIPKIKL